MLDSDLTVSGSDAIDVNAPDVVINLNGYSIIGSSGGIGVSAGQVANACDGDRGEHAKGPWFVIVTDGPKHLAAALVAGIEHAADLFVSIHEGVRLIDQQCWLYQVQESAR